MLIPSKIVVYDFFVWCFYRTEWRRLQEKEEQCNMYSIDQRHSGRELFPIKHAPSGSSGSAAAAAAAAAANYQHHQIKPVTLSLPLGQSSKEPHWHWIPLKHLWTTVSWSGNHRISLARVPSLPCRWVHTVDPWWTSQHCSITHHSSNKGPDGGHKFGMHTQMQVSSQLYGPRQ